MQDLTRRVKWISGIGLEVGLGVFLLAMLFYAWKAPSSQAKAMKKPAAHLNAEGLAAQLPIPATLCIHDDSSPAFLTFDRTTGAFTFNNCAGITASGVGIVKAKGSGFTLNF